MSNAELEIIFILDWSQAVISKSVSLVMTKPRKTTVTLQHENISRTNGYKILANTHVPRIAGMFPNSVGNFYIHLDRDRFRYAVCTSTPLLDSLMVHRLRKFIGLVAEPASPAKAGQIHLSYSTYYFIF